MAKICAVSLTAFLLVASTGCESTGTSTEATASPDAPNSTIGGAGSTFVAPLMSAWIDGYQHAHPKNAVKYRAISGAGIEEFKKGWLEFGASDAPLSDDEIKAISQLSKCPARPDRSASHTTCQGWNIIVIHRSDGSGTTNILTTYLSQISPEWAMKPGKGLSVAWPTGLGADGSKGVLNLVKQSPGTVGYLELNYTKENGVPVASIQNRAGEFVPPTPAAAAAAIEAFQTDLARDVRSPIVDPPASAKDAYPISGFTFLLVPKDRRDKNGQVAVRDFLSYAVSTGQDSAERLSYSKLPPFVRQQAQELLTKLTANGQPLN